MPAGIGPPWHVHPEEDEWFYVLEGDLTVWVADTQLSLKAGWFAFGPKGVPHTFYAEAGGAKALVGFAPMQFEGFQREVGEPAPERVLPRRSRAPRTWRGSRRSPCETGSRSSARQARLPVTRLENIGRRVGQVTVRLSARVCSGRPALASIDVIESPEGEGMDTGRRVGRGRAAQLEWAAATY